MAMSPEQLADIHEKELTRRSTKAALDAAVATHNTAVNDFNTALTNWKAAVEGNANETTRTTLLNAYIAAGVAKNVAEQERTTKGQAASAAEGALNQAVDAVIVQETPVP
jgi:hypothetical protein